MKITDVKVYLLTTGSIIVRVFTDEGISGIGECSPMDRKVLPVFVEQSLKPLVIGKNPLEIQKIWADIYSSKYKLGTSGALMEAMSGIDIALWDILGKYTGLPVYTLLGGNIVNKVLLYSSIGSGWKLTPYEMAKKIEASLNLGFKACKIRMDWGFRRQDCNPEKDYEMFREARRLLGDSIPLSFDANNGYSPYTAIKQGRKMEELGIFHFEEPVAPYDYEGIRKVAEALDVPVSAGEHEYTRWQFKDLIERADVDAIQPDVVKCGGISEMRNISLLAEIYNKTLLPHQTQQTIGTVASIHVCSTFLTGVTAPHEFCMDSVEKWNTLKELFVEPPLYEDGYLVLSEKPGLGLEMDEDMLEKIKM